MARWLTAIDTGRYWKSWWTKVGSSGRAAGGGEVERGEIGEQPVRPPGAIRTQSEGDESHQVDGIGQVPGEFVVVDRPGLARSPGGLAEVDPTQGTALAGEVVGGSPELPQPGLGQVEVAVGLTVVEVLGALVVVVVTGLAHDAVDSPFGQTQRQCDPGCSAAQHPHGGAQVISGGELVGGEDRHGGIGCADGGNPTGPAS